MRSDIDSLHHIIAQIEDYAILRLDAHGTVKDWNKGAEKLKGYKEDEIIGKNFRLFYTAEDRAQHLPEKLIEQAIANGKAMHEGWRVRKDGTRFWGSVLITALRNEQNNVTGFFKITRDLSDRKAMEEQSIREISDYKFALDESAIVAVTDQNGIIKHVNQNFCRISKYTEAELIGSDHRIVNSGHHPKEFIRSLWATIANGKIWKGELKNRAKDGSYYWVDTTIVPFLNDAGKPYQYLAIRYNITLRKKVEEDLIKSNRLYGFLSAINQSIVHISNKKSLLDNACEVAVSTGKFKMAVMALIDANGAINLVSHCGDEAGTEKMFQLAGLSIDDAVLKNTAMSKAVRTGKAFFYNDVQKEAGMAVLKDRFITQGINSVIALPLIVFGKITGFFALHTTVKNFFDDLEIAMLEESAQDISFALENFEKEKERLQATKDLAQLNETLELRVKERTAQLTEVNKALESFSYSVSHDLRAPVRGILGFTEIIQQEYGAAFNAELKGLFEHISANGKRMNSIIDDMLKLARYEKEVLRLAPVNMAQLFTRVWDTMKLTEPHRAALQLGNLPVVEADMSMLEQVLVNLFSNAIKYSSKKEQPVVNVGCDKSDAAYTFFITDNGAGFDMKNYHRLFCAFQRLHGVSEFEGTGVGLLLVKRIIEKHGGTVWAEGKVNQGATFYFTLPVAA